MLPLDELIMPPEDELLDEPELLLLEDDDDELEPELDEVLLDEPAEATVTVDDVEPSLPPPPPHAERAIANAPVRPYR